MWWIELYTLEFSVRFLWHTFQVNSIKFRILVYNIWWLIESIANELLLYNLWYNIILLYLAPRVWVFIAIFHDIPTCFTFELHSGTCIFHFCVLVGIFPDQSTDDGGQLWDVGRSGRIWMGGRSGSKPTSRSSFKLRQLQVPGSFDTLGSLRGPLCSFGCRHHFISYTNC